MNRHARRQQAKDARRDSTCVRHGLERAPGVFAAYFTRSRTSRSHRRAAK